jgi:hypothetical protein
MKKHLTLMIALAAAAVSFASCEKETKWDHYNSDITIFVKNSAGENLCSPSEWGHVLWYPSDKGTTGQRKTSPSIEYKGQTITLAPTGLEGDPQTRSATRAGDGMPEWKGFRWNEGYGDVAALVFGQFSVDTKQYRGETFTINWADGTNSVVVFDFYTTSNGKKEKPTFHEAIRVESGFGAGTQGTTNSLILTLQK